MISSLFSRLPAAPDDPVFAIAAEAQSAGASAINATVGVMLDEDGKPLVLSAVRQAVQECAIAFPQSDFTYPPLLGLERFRPCVTRLIFGEETDTVASIAATGGTGALALLLKLLRLLRVEQVILPVPTWPNHQRLITAQGLAIREVPYLRGGKASVQGVIEALRSCAVPCGVLLQVCGHNPTGLDYDADGWRELAAILRAGGHVPLLDLAYQGLVSGVTEDVAPVRLLREAGVPVLVAWSASKNHSIYGLRTGLACAVADDHSQREGIERHLLLSIREMHSAASVTGQQIVECMQRTYADQWRADLAALRQALSRKRRRLTEAFPDWADALAGAGLYALLPMTPDQILALKRQKIFVLPGGRINIAGIPDARMEEFIEECKKVIRS